MLTKSELLSPPNSLTRIRKRDGRLVKFNAEKVTNALLKAGAATGEFDEKVAKRLTIRVVNIAAQIFQQEAPSVESLQDIVEDVLISSAYSQTAKAYIIYRDQHAQIREIKSKSQVDLVDQYLDKADWQVNENSNMDFSLQGLNNYIASEISKAYWLNKIYPSHIRELHTGGAFHIHDLGLLGAYCVGWDLYDVLLQGFGGVVGKVESRPAKHLRTALGQVVNFFYTLQGESAGAQAFSNFDTLLAPFIRYDNLSYDEVRQAMQEFLFNMNVPTRVGFQTPFTNLTMDLNVPSYYKDSPVIIGGKPQKETYGQFQKELDMFNRAFLEVMLEGDAKGRVFSFPIPTYNITKDFDWDNKNLDLLWEITAKYGIPYFANFINSEMNPEDARSMCCRLRIDNRELKRRGGGLFGASPLTGSIGVVTINMPRLGYLNENEEDFFKSLSQLMKHASESLEIKRKVLETLTDKNLYPYITFYLRSVKQRFGKFWQNHFATIGINGLNECALNLIGKDIGSPEGKAFAERTLNFMRGQIMAFQQETGNNYNLEATPAEGTSYRFAKNDKSLYADIVCANEEAYQKGAKPYYTNSSQLPVNYTDDPFTLLELQDSTQAKYTGGTVVHLFTGERLSDIAALKQFIKTVCTNYTLPYLSITPTFSVCPKCGYKNGEHHSCPDCETESEVYSRIVGYLRPVKQWNEGKKEEFLNRTMLKVCK